MKLSAKAEFANAVLAAQGRGQSYDSAFRSVCLTRPDLVKAMRRAPLVGPARDAQAARLRSEFSNDGAASALGTGLSTILSADLKDSLGVGPTDPDTTVRQKIITGAGGLSSSQLDDLWKCICSALQRKFGSAAAAQSKATALFPKLFDMLSPS